MEREKKKIKYSERDYSSLLFERQAKPLGYDTGDELTRGLEEQAEWLCGKLLLSFFLSFNPSCLHWTVYWGGQGLFGELGASDQGTRFSFQLRGKKTLYLLGICRKQFFPSSQPLLRQEAVLSI